MLVKSLFSDSMMVVLPLPFYDAIILPFPPKKNHWQVMFVAVPGICLLISLLYSASVAGGVVVTLLFLGAVAGLIFWWVKLGGCYKVVSLEDVFSVLQKPGRAWEGKMSGRTILSEF